MHKLSRQIRFAIDPFAQSRQLGANSYCAKPTADALAFYFSLWVQLESNVDKETGFVVNVAQIDKVVRSRIIGLFESFLKTERNLGYMKFCQLLSKSWQTIENDFLPARISSLCLETMPARKIAIKERTGDMLYFSEKFEFSSSHTLWNNKFTDEENFKIFGKCANLRGHGHNYIIEITIRKQFADNQIIAGDFEKIIDGNFIQVVDHKNLNEDVDFFKTHNPTVENIAEFAFKCLDGKFEQCKLDCVTVWENDRTFCTYKND